MKKKYISPLLLLFGSLMLGVSVLVGYYVVPHQVRENILKNSKIIQGNTRFEKWQALPESVKLYQKIYFFNVTNPEEVVLGGKPILQEIGPYVYQQKRRKFNIVFNEDNGTIFYREKTVYFFNPELTNGSLDDKITFVNLPYVGAAHKASQLDPVTRYVISETLRSHPKEQLYMKTTIRKLLFEGTYLPFIKDLAELNGEEILPNNTFGLYYLKNGTDQGLFEIFSGVKYPDKFGNVVSWNGKKSLDWWDNEYCNRINGSDGGVFTPYSTNETVFQMFIPGLCKTFRFEYEPEDGLMVKGIPVLKFSIKPSLFQSPRENPENACFCVNPGKNYENCPESGVFPLEGCGRGAMMLSQPHFYQGSDVLRNSCIGLNPEKSRHEMTLLIETYTSAPARASIRFQMNIGLKPNKFFRPLKKVPKLVHPLFWIDQTVDIPDESADLLRDKLYFTINTANLLTQIGIIVGLCLIIVSLLAFCLCSYGSPENEKAKAGDIGCVSYYPSGTLQNGKISMKPNSNGKLPNGSAKNGHGQGQYECVELFQKRSGDNDDGLVNQNNSKQSKIDPKPVISNASNNSPAALPMDTSMSPDSHLNPFPVLTDFSSSSSIGHDQRANLNTLKNVVEATSSYENL